MAGPINRLIFVLFLGFYLVGPCAAARGAHLMGVPFTGARFAVEPKGSSAGVPLSVYEVVASPSPRGERGEPRGEPA